MYTNEKLGSTLVTMLYIDNFIELDVAFEDGLSPYCFQATTLSDATSKTKFEARNS
jgi:hypothetical protein